MKDYLEHYGVPGQRWGVRNYQNADGSLTSKGRQHYDVGDGRGGRNAFSLKAGYNRAMARAMDVNANYYSKRNSRYAKQMAGIKRSGANRARKDAERMQLEANKKAQERLDKRSTPEYKAKVKKAAVIGGSAAAAVLAAYGLQKYKESIVRTTAYDIGKDLGKTLGALEFVGEISPAQSNRISYELTELMERMGHGK